MRDKTLSPTPNAHVPQPILEAQYTPFNMKGLHPLNCTFFVTLQIALIFDANTQKKTDSLTVT